MNEICDHHYNDVHSQKPSATQVLIIYPQPARQALGGPDGPAFGKGPWIAPPAVPVRSARPAAAPRTGGRRGGGDGMTEPLAGSQGRPALCIGCPAGTGRGRKQRPASRDHIHKKNRRRSWRGFFLRRLREADGRDRGHRDRTAGARHPFRKFDRREAAAGMKPPNGWRADPGMKGHWPWQPWITPTTTRIWRRQACRLGTCAARRRLAASRSTPNARVCRRMDAHTGSRSGTSTSAGIRGRKKLCGGPRELPGR